MIECGHGVAQAQSDPLNSAYKPTVDCNSADYPSNIALSGPLVKLRQDSGSPSGVYGAASCITVMATQNEFQSFQVHVEAPTGGYSALNITMSSLVKSTGPGGNYTIPAPDATHTDIVVYREAYIHVTTISAPSSIFYGSTGYYPDPLVPAIDPYYHQTTGAFPVSVAANQNQSAWIDVYIPQNAPSGWYQGTVSISNSSTTLATMPVIYGVWQWPASAGGYMPSTATLHSVEFSGYDSLCKVAYTTEASCDSSYPRGGGSDNADVASKEDLAVQLLDNRLTLSASTAYWPNTIDTNLENGVSTGGVERIMPGSKIGPNDMWGSKTSASVSSYITTLTTNGWYDLPNGGYDYLVDEPGSTCSNWTTPISTASASRSWSTPMLPMLVTASISDMTTCSATNAVDWAVVNIASMEPIGGRDQRSSYDTWLSGNCCSGSGPTRQLWSYLSCDPNCGNQNPSYTYPNYDIDAYPVANRAMEWMSFRNQQVGELYYALDACFYYNCGGSSPNPWASNYEFGNNGDGDLLYYGTNSTNCSTCGGAFVNVSTPIWIPSIRLKMMRDGMQDYEYLNLLTNEGEGSLVQSEISSWITNAYTFSVAPSGLTAARQALGQAIHQLTYPVAALQPPANVTATLQ